MDMTLECWSSFLLFSVVFIIRAERVANRGELSLLFLCFFSLGDLPEVFNFCTY
jgi:hypothetical protein